MNCQEPPLLRAELPPWSRGTSSSRDEEAAGPRDRSGMSPPISPRQDLPAIPESLWQAAHPRAKQLAPPSHRDAGVGPELDNLGRSEFSPGRGCARDAAGAVPAWGAARLLRGDLHEQAGESRSRARSHPTPPTPPRLVEVFCSAGGQGDAPAEAGHGDCLQTALLPALQGAVVLFLERVCAALLASIFSVFPLLLSYQSRE